MDEKEQLSIMCQRLKDEVRGRCGLAIGGHDRVVGGVREGESNKMMSLQKVYGHMYKINVHVL